MLLWEMFFFTLLVVGLWSFYFSTKTIFSLLLNAEFIIVVLFFLSISVSVYSNINILFGLAYLLLILGGLELALNIILLVL